MNKPSLEVIALAKELHDLGAKKEPEVGDWIVPKNKDRKWCHLAQTSSDTKYVTVINAIVIPNLAWCMEWLRENTKAVTLSGTASAQGWLLLSSGELGWCNSDSPLVAALKVMIEAHKQQKEKS